MNGAGRKFRGKHDTSIARSGCTCRHTFLCNVRKRGDTCLTAPAAFPPAAFPPGTPARRPPSRPPPFLPPRPAPPSFLAAGQHRRTQWVQAYPWCGCHPLAGQNHGGHDGGMSFFDGVPVPTAEPVPPWSQRPWDPPEAGFPGVVPFRTLILARTERAAVAITGLSAYSAGFEIYVTARFRPGTDTGPAGPGPGGPGPGGPLQSFRFGLQLADGTKVIGQRGGRGPDLATPSRTAPSCGCSSAAPARVPACLAGGRGRCRPPARWSSSASGPPWGSPRAGPGWMHS